MKVCVEAPEQPTNYAHAVYRYNYLSASSLPAPSSESITVHSG